MIGTANLVEGVKEQYVIEPKPFGEWNYEPIKDGSGLLVVGGNG